MMDRGGLQLIWGEPSYTISPPTCICQLLIQHYSYSTRAQGGNGLFGIPDQLPFSMLHIYKEIEPYKRGSSHSRKDCRL